MRRTAVGPIVAARRFAFAVAVLLLCSGAPAALASPALPVTLPGPVRSIPDWLSLDGATRLDVGFDVLVPAAVPAPFGGEPEITAYDGYYSLYWVIPGTPPTFLQVTGEAGGSIPDYSKYDRNVQLEQNAAVSGSPAYHDQTPIYDLVYWQVDNVVYSVESQNLEGTDSLSLANALAPLDGGNGSATGGDGSTGTSEEPEPVVAAQTDALALACPGRVAGGSLVPITLTGSGGAIVDAGAGTFPAEPPNTDFAPNADGGATLAGTVPNGGAELVWLAPELGESQTVSLFASTEAGDTPGECAVLVTGARAESAASGAQELGASGTDAVAGSQQQDETAAPNPAIEPSATAEPKPTKTPKGYNEVVGLPTAMPYDDGTGGIDGRTVPTATVPPTATVRPTPTYAPTTDDNGMVAQTIGPDGGTLTSTALGVSVTIDRGALAEPVTLSIQPVGDTKLPVANDVQLLPGSGFDVAMAAPDGSALTDPLKKPAEVRFAVQGGPNDQARLYRVDGSSVTALANTRLEDGALVVSVTEFSRFVAGVPAASSVETSRNVLPFVLAAVVVVLVLMAMVVLGGMFRPRRQRIVVSRRPPTRSRYR